MSLEQETVTPLFPATPHRRQFTEAEAAGIAARVRHAQLPWWERLFAARPPSWEQTADPYR